MEKEGGAEGKFWGWREGRGGEGGKETGAWNPGYRSPPDLGIVQFSAWEGTGKERVREGVVGN